MEKIIKKSFCDRCGEEFERSGRIFEHISWTISGYSKQGDGGINENNLEFCNNCSEKLNCWRFNKGIVLDYGDIEALKTILDFVERYNKQDKETLVASAQNVLQLLLEKDIINKK